MIESPIQKQIMKKAIESPIFAKEVLSQAPLDIFEGNEIYKELSQIIRRYYSSHRDKITEEALLTLTEDKLTKMRKDPETQQSYFNAISGLYEIRNSHDDSVTDENIEKHIRKHMLLDVVKKNITNLDGSEKTDKFIQKITEVQRMDISGKQQEIINVIDDVEYKRRALSTLNQDLIRSGINGLDNITDGGLAKGELGLIVAASGTGKTLWLTNLATSYTKQKKNVLFIALEELENRMILRFEQSMLRVNRSTLLTGRKLNEANFDKLQNAYKNAREHLGNLLFARYSPRTITPAKIEQLISDVTLRMGIELDVVIIDYPELLRNPHATGNEADDGGKLFEEMRRIGQDYRVLMWTAAQMNRSNYNAAIKTSEHMEGSHRKKNAAELVVTVNQTEEEFNAGFTRLYIDKLRNPPAGNFNRMVGFKVVGSQMTVRDYEGNEAEDHKAILEEVDNKNEQLFKGKKRDKKENAPQIDYSAQINQYIHAQRQIGS
ncbi:DNA helicase [Bacillus phage Grass]|uniref:DNA helicase n=1 Tax=Bacillus phage Grass TaxID=1406785 RepID=U5PXQ6_BPGRA|nr:helicase DnaB-like [Bacillus phage Grass]AGY47367.1 DNA helicase [Bacillus phage Grass]